MAKALMRPIIKLLHNESGCLWYVLLFCLRFSFFPSYCAFCLITATTVYTVFCLVTQVAGVDERLQCFWQPPLKRF